MLEEDCAFFGIPPETLSASAHPQTGLWPEHVAAVETFLAISGQWRVLPRWGAPPHYLGLDYAAAEAGLRLAGVTVSPARWEEVRLIECGAMAELNGT